MCRNNEIGELIDLEFDLFSFSLNAFGLFMLFFTYEKSLKTRENGRKLPIFSQKEDEDGNEENRMKMRK